MMAIERITSSQFRMLVLYSTCSTSILSMPLILGSMAGRDSWWIVLLGTLLGAPIVFMLLTLARWYPKSTFFSNKPSDCRQEVGTAMRNCLYASTTTNRFNKAALFNSLYHNSPLS